MTIQAWEQVKELLHQAMQLDPEQRAPFLDKACSSDVALRAELESLLLAGEGVPAGFLQAASAGAESERIDPAGALEAGQIFAQHFQLVRKLGEGGMGQIWLAEQTSPVRRQVALKLIKAGMYDQAVLQRFQAERQSLAIMDHPAIAKVFDAGSTPAGQPYFVMEYVPGLPITNFCDHHSPRSETFKHLSGGSRWQACAADYRLRHCQGHFAAIFGSDFHDARRRNGRHSRLYEPGASRSQRPRHRHPH
jgi:hypothetical protein